MNRASQDSLRDLLDAVLGGIDLDGRRAVPAMAEEAFVSAGHLTRAVSRAAGESPAAMRRRVLLERAAWRLAHGAPVTDAAWEAGFDSAEGFSRAFRRAFGHPPSEFDGDGHWLSADNGVHFHPPASLWIEAKGEPMNPLSELLVEHDLDDTTRLIALASELSDAEWNEARWPGHAVLEDGPEESIGAVLQHLVGTKAVWIAAIEGNALPDLDLGPARLAAQHDELAPRWRRIVHAISARDGWDDVLVDTLCTPPESFPMRGVIAHVLEFSAYRRQVARRMLAESGQIADTGDPIMWMRSGWSRS